MQDAILYYKIFFLHKILLFTQYMQIIHDLQQPKKYCWIKITTKSCTKKPIHTIIDIDMVLKWYIIISIIYG